ncbi:MAG: dTDP-4-dehydrorhamnose reductase [Edaphobacter sp.]|nr:dTDP-4-dehydrorhamnose reductase [Edaphobacter sp.]
MNLRSPMELWAGVECTINRVGATFHDQYSRSGHRERVHEDMQMFAGLGLQTLRTAVHWEHFERTNCWSCADCTLQAMEQFGLRPIVGMLHHGSGPPSTSLLDKEFPEKFAAFALQVTKRYPWVLDYTPINEPQTTGRFACLYGHWFPHHRNMRSYVRALFHQIKAIVLSMQAIRSVQPEARLIHTEDGGSTFSTQPLEPYRMEREHRRWLGLDLLCGSVTRNHPLFQFLLDYGLEEREILWFTERPCPPSVIGLNYYVTSDRFLDHRVHLYPNHFRGGDLGTEPLVDIDAVRIRPEGIVGVGALLTQAWDRYQLPVAITEAHLGCEPDQQVRWLAQTWHEAQQAFDAGVNVRAVTAWGLLGLYDWCNLCTSNSGVYEPGVFDLSSGTPVPTPVATLVQQLAQGHPVDKGVLSSFHWWRENSRLTHTSPAIENSIEPESAGIAVRQ